MKRPLAVLASSALSLACASVPCFAGEIQLSWDAVSGATGYRVYYGSASGNYPNSKTVSGTSTTLSGLPDCATHFVAVKAINGAGESPEYSNEVSGWPRPTVTSSTPSQAKQGDQVTMNVTGSNFQPGASIDLGDPNIVPSSVSVLSCTQIQLLATVEPTASNVRPAEVGRRDVTVVNPDDVFGTKLLAFEVLIDPYRYDINRTDTATTNRIDGKDTIFISRGFAASDPGPNYDPDYDFDGDGWVDGQDLAYIAGNLGRCWSSSTESWSASACPSTLR